MKIEQNISRLKYLLSLYGMTSDDLVGKVNEGLKKKVVADDLLSADIKLINLKRIDKVFKKGLNFYLDPASPDISRDASIFFRKNSFETDLNVGARRIVNQFEDFKISLSALAKLADLNFRRKLPVVDISDSSAATAVAMRKALYPAFHRDLKSFLEALIHSFAEKNILVFEFVETWNKKDKANIDGVFMQPNVIVLKRLQTAFRREIFTLIHELGHYLLTEEEVESLTADRLADRNPSMTERWCNDFAYHFLAGDYDNLIEEVSVADASNDYCRGLVEDISAKTHLSKIALYTRMLHRGKISETDYEEVKQDFDDRFREKQEAERKQKEIDKALGIERGGGPQIPIKSPLLVQTIQSAYYEGVIGEYEVCRALNIRPEQIDDYLQ